MRCKACDALMTEKEVSVTQSDGSPEDLCGECLGIVALDLDDADIDFVNTELSTLFDETEEVSDEA